MRSTLFFIPHEILGLPVMGWGWALILLGIWSIAWIGWRHHREKNWNAASEYLPFMGVIAALILFVFPNMETQYMNADGKPVFIGMPIRGYGLMLMLGALSGVGLVSTRSRKEGISVDDLLSLAFWVCGAGILGARVFYVIQKWSELPGGTLGEKLYSSLKFTEGGLVVYGGIIGGVAAIFLWSRLRRRNPFAIFDLVAPGFMVGLGFGRLGCFLHGCCFGGICAVTYLPAVTFPSGSEPYMAEVLRGELLGLKLRDANAAGKREILEVAEGSWAERAGLKVGQSIEGLYPELSFPDASKDPAGPQRVELTLKVDGVILTTKNQALPERSLSLHPAQIYASINGFLIAGVLYFFWPLTQRQGYVFALGLLLYAIARWFEEAIRVDELGQFGTSLTIAQWISIGGAAIAFAIFILQRRSLRVSLKLPTPG
ncbi:MAG: prolipoprotein diacylglyceryl transferase family protein [Pirellulales bacterium]